MGRTPRGRRGPKGTVRARSGSAEIVRAADGLGIRWLTAYGFSTENWRRPRLEVDFILGLHKKIFGRRTEMHANNVKIRWIGRDPRAGSRIPAIVRREIEKSTRLTADNTGLNFTVAFDYGGRQELVAAARTIASAPPDEISPDAINEHTVAQHVYAPDLPPVDLMIRTSGEARISNFLLWGGVGAQLYVTPTLWPDFGAVELERALDWWRERVV